MLKKDGKQILEKVPLRTHVAGHAGVLAGDFWRGMMWARPRSGANK